MLEIANLPICNNDVRKDVNSTFFPTWAKRKQGEFFFDFWEKQNITGFPEYRDSEMAKEDYNALLFVVVTASQLTIIWFFIRCVVKNGAW